MKMKYVAPEVEVMETLVEVGFAGSEVPDVPAGGDGGSGGF